jgi:malic enzyme
MKIAAAGRSPSLAQARTCRTTSRPPTRACARDFGAQYIIPVPFDPRLISAIPVAVAKAAMERGVARKNIPDLDAYARESVGSARPDRLDAPAVSMSGCAASRNVSSSPRARRSR